MHIYDAIAFDKKIESGGSTYPWIVTVLNHKKQPIKYVVKLFTERQMVQQNPIAKEVFGNILAKEFELYVPEIALVNFGDDFCQTLSLENIKTLNNKHNGLKFGSEYIDSAAIVNISNQKNAFWKSYDIGSIFAFDSLIGNLDRGGARNKPNLLIKNEDFILIDHEQIFTFADDENIYNDAIITDFRKGSWRYNAQQHLFFPFLKSLKNSEKENIFDTFHEHLSHLNFNLLDNSINFLIENNLPMGNYPLIKNYLAEIKNDSGRFINLLKQSIS